MSENLSDNYKTENKMDLHFVPPPDLLPDVDINNNDLPPPPPPLSNINANNNDNDSSYLSENSTETISDSENIIMTSPYATHKERPNLNSNPWATPPTSPNVTQKESPEITQNEIAWGSPNMPQKPKAKAQSNPNLVSFNQSINTQSVSVDNIEEKHFKPQKKTNIVIGGKRKKNVKVKETHEHPYDELDKLLEDEFVFTPIKNEQNEVDEKSNIEPLFVPFNFSSNHSNSSYPPTSSSSSLYPPAPESPTFTLLPPPRSIKTRPIQFHENKMFEGDRRPSMRELKSTQERHMRQSREQGRRRNLSCLHCKMIFKNEDSYHEHMRRHNNEFENTVCVCKICGMIFESDELYYNHKRGCNYQNANSQENIIPTDPKGQYICPLCDNRYSNTFYLGEHFISSHNDYSVLCKLDERIHNGFPGFKVLYKINMIKKIKSAEINEHKNCEICCFEFTYNIDEINKYKTSDDIISENRNPLKLTCCGHTLCHDCLMSHISISDSIICPYCTKDHTQNDLKYVTFVDIIDVTDRDKWLPWWENHMEIFYRY